MRPNTFKALLVEEKNDGHFTKQVQEVPISILPDHDVLVQVHYSDLNYKDGLSASGNKGVTRTYPHIPGVDASGVVVEDRSGTFTPGQEVVVTGYDMGQDTDGGFGQYISVPAEWVVPLPAPLTLFDTMVLGTPGFTAAYGVYRLLELNVPKDKGPVVVTGATGGVGYLAVHFLAKEGYEVVASTGKMEQTDFLKKMGASDVIHREEFTNQPGRPLLSSRWAAAYDTVGGKTLDVLIRQVGHNGTIVCCGNIGGHTVESSIYPFILRGISLLGVDSSNTLMPKRMKIWEMMAGYYSDVLRASAKIISLQELPSAIDEVLAGNRVGSVVLKHDID